MELDPAAFSYQCDIVDGKVKGSAWGAMSTVDSLGKVPMSVAIDDRDESKHEGEPGHPHVPWSKTVIYELHVKGFTPTPRGCRRSCAAPTPVWRTPPRSPISNGWGVTVHRAAADSGQAGRAVPAGARRHHYWGYSTLSYFAPEPSYATRNAQRKGAAAVRKEVIDMVRALHEAGFEVIMDVVYNHTCEGGVEGPTVCWRGLDTLTYYRQQKGNPGRLEDTTAAATRWTSRIRRW